MYKKKGRVSVEKNECSILKAVKIHTYLRVRGKINTREQYL